MLNTRGGTLRISRVNGFNDAGRIPVNHMVRCKGHSSAIRGVGRRNELSSIVCAMFDCNRPQNSLEMIFKMPRSCPRLTLGHLGLIASLSLSSAAIGATYEVSPDSLKIRRGSISGQGIEVLAEQSQAGNEDDWETYVELYPANQRFVGMFTFHAPVDTTSEMLDWIDLSINFRGPEFREQPWVWHLKNQRTRRWIPLGTNRNISDWRWTEQHFAVPGDLADYLDVAGRLNARLLSRRAGDNANLDSILIEIGTRDITGPTQPPVAGPGEIWQPRPGTSWQWQLQGNIDTSINAEMYDIDLFDTPESVISELHDKGRAVICYFSAGSWESWRSDAQLFPESVKGRQNGWPGERWLDIRQTSILGPIIHSRLDLAVEKGCDGVEPDNIDAYSNNSGFPLTGQDQIDFNIWLANAAHERGLSIGLKNDLDQVTQLEPYFDWALNEQCYQYNECELLTPFVNAGKAVFGVEYRGDPARFCSRTNALDFDWLKKNLSLNVARESCR
ncbi:MAG: endo alpha-1,4 polygalactosaminidase [Granulosicoccus sp.]